MYRIVPKVYLCIYSHDFNTYMRETGKFNGLTVLKTQRPLNFDVSFAIC